MPTPLEIAGVGAMGNVNYYILPAIAGAIPTTTEMGAAGAMDVTGFLYADSTQASHTANKVTAPRRMADKRQYQRFGLTVDDAGQMKYMIDPAAATGANGKKVAAICVEGSAKFLVRRAGYDVGLDVAIGQFLRWAPITFGPQFEVVDPSAEENEIYTMQDIVVTVPGWSALVAIAS